MIMGGQGWNPLYGSHPLRAFSASCLLSSTVGLAVEATGSVGDSAQLATFECVR